MPLGRYTKFVRLSLSLSTLCNYFVVGMSTETRCYHYRLTHNDHEKLRAYVWPVIARNIHDWMELCKQLGIPDTVVMARSARQYVNSRRAYERSIAKKNKANSNINARQTLSVAEPSHDNHTPEPQPTTPCLHEWSNLDNEIMSESFDTIHNIILDAYDTHEREVVEHDEEEVVEEVEEEEKEEEEVPKRFYSYVRYHDIDNIRFY